MDNDAPASGAPLVILAAKGRPANRDFLRSLGS
jgi:hypothetical protein